MEDRFSRQADLVPMRPDIVVDVIGCGAIGRNVALQLAAIGTPNVRLIDFDTVEYHNVTTQGFPECRVGDTKVTAVHADISMLDYSINVSPYNDRWRPKYGLSQAVFMCVDKMEVRSLIWEFANRMDHPPEFYCDGRMNGEVMRILTACDTLAREHYPTTLFSDAEATPGRCTAKSTIYTANIAAGLMLHQFTRWLRGMPCSKDVELALLSGEMTESIT